MFEQIKSALDEIGARYRDTRICYYQVEAECPAERECRLSGAVLDRESYADVTETLLARFPEVCFDAADLRILRSPTPRLLRVATNLTSLHAQPSFLAEMVSQLLNGWTLEVLIERERWGFVRQEDGYLGWAYLPYLAETAPQQSTHIASAPVSLLHCEPAREAAIATRLLGGTAVSVGQVEGDWGYVVLSAGTAGWLPLAHLRALDVLPSSPEAQRRQMVEDALRFIGTPYLWGGCTAFGIDCSGFAQLLHRLAGITLPRDADMQFHAGRPVEPPFRPGDLLFFAGDAPGSIGHVGMSLGGWRIIHSSRSRNGVYQDDVQAVPHLRDSFAGARTFIAG